ncbi:MAG: hypothetical protein AB1774_09040, partial [Bacillota bacterium]
MEKLAGRVVRMIRQPGPWALVLVVTGIAAMVGGMQMSTAIAAGESRVEALLSRMTVEEKVGQMVMAGFPGKLPEAEVRILIEQWH